MSADHRGRHLETLRGVMTTMLYPLQYAVDLPIRAGDWLAENISTREALVAENEKLRESAAVALRHPGDVAALDAALELSLEEERPRRPSGQWTLVETGAEPAPGPRITLHPASQAPPPPSPSPIFRSTKC